jgi:hypothetical protein
MASFAPAVMLQKENPAPMGVLDAGLSSIAFALTSDGSLARTLSAELTAKIVAERIGARLEHDPLRHHAEAANSGGRRCVARPLQVRAAPF